MAHAQCMLDTKGYTHTLRIYSTYFFSAATMVARKRLRVTLYVHSPSVILLCTIVGIYGRYVKYDLRLSVPLRIIVFLQATPCNLVATSQNIPYHTPTHCRSTSKALSVQVQAQVCIAQTCLRSSCYETQVSAKNRQNVGQTSLKRETVPCGQGRVKGDNTVHEPRSYKCKQVHVYVADGVTSVLRSFGVRRRVGC